MKTTKQSRLHKVNVAVKVATVVAFLGMAAVVTIAAFRAGAEVQTQAIADSNNIPKAWNGTQSLNAVANSSLAAEVLDGRYVEYTAQVKNANSGDGLYVTHLASYLSTDGVDADGFVALVGGYVEYTYTPDKSESWEMIGLTRPADGLEAFKLAKEIRLGTAGSKTDTVYFRFYVEPNDRETQNLNNKVSFLVRNDAGEVGYAGSTATVAYFDANDMGTEVATTEGADDDISNAYTNPLGRSSFVPGVEVAMKTVAGVQGEVNGAVWWVVGAVGVGLFVVCLGLYLPLKKY